MLVKAILVVLLVLFVGVVLRIAAGYKFVTNLQITNLLQTYQIQITNLLQIGY